MNAQPFSAPESQPAIGIAPSGDATRTPEQKAQAKALKKVRKHERLRFFLGWCEGCQAFGSVF